MFGCLCCVVPPVAIPATVLPCAGVVFTTLALGWCSGMVSDGFQTQRRDSSILGKERAERVLAGAISIDGRKEWTCKFCSESNVWTRWRCRRFCNDIPEGFRGKYRRAVPARTGDRSTGSSISFGEEDRKSKGLETENKELRAKHEYYEKRETEGAQRGQGLPARRESGMEEEWGTDMDVEDEIESRKKAGRAKEEIAEGAARD